MAWFNKRKPDPSLPPKPCPDTQRKIEQEKRQAEKELQKAERRDKEVTQHSREANRIRKENHLGPRFWDAIGLRREEG